MDLPQHETALPKTVLHETAAHGVRPPLPLLITGVAGVAGYNAFRYFRKLYGEQVIAIRRPDNWPIQRAGVFPCAVEDAIELSRLFEEFQFASVLYCGGSCALKSCELDPAMAWRVNVHGISSMLDVIKHRPTRLVFSSIDLVFSGDSPFSGNGRRGYTEEAPPDPVTVYGKTMQVAEQVILDRRPDACVLRISLPMGESFNGHAGAIDWIQSRFQKSKPATLYYDEIRTPTYTDCLNRVFAEVLRRDLRGIYHAGGPRRLSLYEIAQVVNRLGGYDPDCLFGCPRMEAGPMPPRAGDVTLDSSKLTAALGRPPFDPWPYHEEHAPTHHEWHRERTPNDKGSSTHLEAMLYCNPAAR